MHFPVPVWASIAAGVCALVGAMIGALVNPYFTSRLNERTRRLDLYKTVYPQKVEASKQLMLYAAELKSLLYKLELLSDDHLVPNEEQIIKYSTGFQELCMTIIERARTMDELSDSGSWLMHFRVQILSVQYTNECRKQANTILASMRRDVDALHNILESHHAELSRFGEDLNQTRERIKVDKKSVEQSASSSETSTLPSDIEDLIATRISEVDAFLTQFRINIATPVKLSTLPVTVPRAKVDYDVIQDNYQELWDAVREENHIDEFDRLFTNKKNRDKWVHRRQRK